MNCPYCNKILDSDARFCTGCGRKLPLCPTCGALLRKSSRFCENDGTPIPQEILDLFQTARAVQTPTPQPAPQPASQPAPQSNSLTKILPLLIVIPLVLIIAATILIVSFSKGPQDSEQLVQIQSGPAMPDLVGQHFSEVNAAIPVGPYTFEYIYEYSDSVEADHIISQSITPGLPLTDGTTITIHVSKGKDVSPTGYDQKVVVTAAPGSSYGTLTLYNWEDGQWVQAFSCNATVGSKGISTDYGEGKKRTPMGTFKLGVALSANSIPNNNWPSRLVSSSSCIVDDTDSSLYNTLQTTGQLPRGTSYDPIGNTLTRGYSNILIYIEHNGNGLDSSNVVAGRGSVITICGRHPSLAPTAGCVDISASNMVTLIGMLDYNKNPHIEITTQ